MQNKDLNLFNGIEKYDDRQEMLKSIILQLEKDTGLDYTEVKSDADDPVFLENLRKDLANHIKKIAGQSHTRYMNLIYRTDIPQGKLKKIDMDEFYFHRLAEMVLSRMFQKVVTRKYLKS